jgi:uncharacterized protein DUF3105
MSSRQEEKEQRRKAREEAERLAKASASRTRRLQIVGGVVLGVAVIVVAVVLVVSGGGGGSDDASQPSENVTSDVTLPARKITDLTAAAKAGGCTVKTYPIEGREHTTSTVTYKTNPPTSGNHNPVPAEDGVYDPGNTPTPEHFVHSLEHGRIEFQYKPGSPQKTIDTLTAIFNEPLNGTPGYHALVFANNTGMTAPIAAAAWGHLITCDDLGAGAIDALRAFRAAYTDKGPELIP